MSSQATISIAGLYDFDNRLFDNMLLPDQVDKDTVIANILMECEGLELLYISYPFLKQAIGFWSKGMIHKWTKLYETMHFDYNPIWNKDGVRIHNEDDVVKSERDTNVEDKTGSTSNNYGAGYNTPAGLTNRERDVVQNNGNVKTDDDNTDTITRRHKDIEQGNIGITSTQQLIREEREIDNFNLYEVIAKDFKQKFCIQVY